MTRGQQIKEHSSFLNSGVGITRIEKLTTSFNKNKA